MLFRQVTTRGSFAGNDGNFRSGCIVSLQFLLSALALSGFLLPKCTMGCWCRCLSIVCWSILVHINSTHKHTISQKINIKYEVTVWISKTEFLFSYESALVWPCLGITSPERNANRIRSIPTQLPPNSAFSPPHSAAGSHDLSHVPDMICGLGLEADGASVPLCCFRRRVQRVQQFSGFRKSSSEGLFFWTKGWLDCITKGQENHLGYLSRWRAETLAFTTVDVNLKKVQVS